MYHLATLESIMNEFRNAVSFFLAGKRDRLIQSPEKKLYSLILNQKRVDYLAKK
jgi:hypothetical protein